MIGAADAKVQPRWFHGEKTRQDLARPTERPAETQHAPRGQAGQTCYHAHCRKGVGAVNEPGPRAIVRHGTCQCDHGRRLRRDIEHGTRSGGKTTLVGTITRRDGVYLAFDLLPEVAITGEDHLGPGQRRLQ